MIVEAQYKNKRFEQEIKINTNECKTNINHENG